MLGKPLRKRILEGKVLGGKYQYQDLKIIRDNSDRAIRDLTLILKKMDEKWIGQIFTAEKLNPLLKAMLNKKNKRVFEITELYAGLASEKLRLELPSDIVNNLGKDIVKTWVFAKLLTDYADKPLMRQSKK